MTDRPATAPKDPRPPNRPVEPPKPVEIAVAPTELNRLAAVDYDKRFSADGKWLATASDDSTIRNRRTCSTDPPASVIGAMR